MFQVKEFACLIEGKESQAVWTLSRTNAELEYIDRFNHGYDCNVFERTVTYSTPTLTEV